MVLTCNRKSILTDFDFDYFDIIATTLRHFSTPQHTSSATLNVNLVKVIFCQNRVFFALLFI